jgi:7-cyano-7-deazaguanine reductase
MNSVEHSLLGKSVSYSESYAPELLFPIPRAAKRDEIGVPLPLPFHGVDIWNAYELSWLDPRGKPVVALAEFRIPALSPNIIESKSFKLYLNSFAQTRLDCIAEVERRLYQDLSAAAAAPVSVKLQHAGGFAQETLCELDGDVIDELDIAIDSYDAPQPEFLTVAGDDIVEEALVSHLLKSNCPVTGQPDWASVQIRYRGARMDRAGLLRYLVSFRRHSDFHEQCVERIFMDISHRCAPQALAVYARYTRRGGLDINPFRSTGDEVPANPRGARQ